MNVTMWGDDFVEKYKNGGTRDQYYKKKYGGKEWDDKKWTAGKEKWEGRKRMPISKEGKLEELRVSEYGRERVGGRPTVTLTDIPKAEGEKIHTILPVIEKMVVDYKMKLEERRILAR